MPHYINDSDTEQNVLARDNYYSRSMPFKDLIDNEVPYYKPQHLHQDEANAMLFPTSLGKYQIIIVISRYPLVSRIMELSFRYT